MMGRTHLWTGVTAASWTAVPLAAAGAPPGLCIVSIPVGAYAALLPDLDTPHSTASWSLPPLSNTASWVIRGGPVNLSLPIVGWGWEGRALPWSVRHRYELHTKVSAVIFGLVLGLPLWLIPVIGGQCLVFAIQIMVGCLTHRWGDQRTAQGLPGRDGERIIRGVPFEVDSDREHHLRRVVYTPVAILSVIGAFLIIAAIAK